MNRERLTTLWAQALTLAILAAVIMPIPEALAQLDPTVEATRSNVFGPILKLLSFACYVIGGVLAVAGILKFKQYSENAQTHPLSHGFARIGAGAALLALPFLMGVLNQTARTTLNGTATFTEFGF